MDEMKFDAEVARVKAELAELEERKYFLERELQQLFRKDLQEHEHLRWTR